MTEQYLNQALDDAMTLMWKYEGTPRAEMWRNAYRRLAKIKHEKFPHPYA